MSIAIYPGSFDPVTNGHVDVIRRFAPHFESLIVVVADSTNKQYLFNKKERVELVQRCFADSQRIRVESWAGLTIDCAQKLGAKVILRGIRAVSDFEYEFAIANTYRSMDPELETMIAITTPGHSFVSSRIVKEVAQFGGDVSQFVPDHVASALANKFKMKGN